MTLINLFIYLTTHLAYFIISYYIHWPIAPNQVIARSEFEVHREIYTEWM